MNKKKKWIEMKISRRSHLAEEKKSSSSATAQSVNGEFSQREGVACCLRCEEFESCEGAGLGEKRNTYNRVFQRAPSLRVSLAKSNAKCEEHETSQEEEKVKQKRDFFEWKLHNSSSELKKANMILREDDDDESGRRDGEGEASQ